MKQLYKHKFLARYFIRIGWKLNLWGTYSAVEAMRRITNPLL